jgi:hypothetical protein
MGRPSPGRTASAPEVKANTLGWFKRLSAQEPMGILARRSA